MKHLLCHLFIPRKHCAQHTTEGGRGVERLGVQFHLCRQGQEVASMLGNEVTGHSVNTHGSFWPWLEGGYRIALKMEMSIKLICQPFGHCVGPLDGPDSSQQEGGFGG